MARLYDKVRRGDAKKVGGVAITDKEIFDVALDSSRVIIADDVFEQFGATMGREKLDFRRDFIAPVPPMSSVWVEARPRPEVSGRIMGDELYSWGALAQCYDVTLADGVAEGDITVAHTKKHVQEYFEQNFGIEEDVEIITPARYYVGGVLYAEPKKNVVRGPLMSYFLAVQADGEVAQAKPQGHEETKPCFWTSSALHTAQMAIGVRMLAPILYTLSLLGCKNVTDDAVLVEPGAKLSRAHRKRHGTELSPAVHVVIDIAHQRERYKTRPGKAGLTLRNNKALGRFERYTKAAPYRGETVGTIWWPPSETPTAVEFNLLETDKPPLDIMIPNRRRHG